VKPRKRSGYLIHCRRKLKSPHVIFREESGLAQDPECGPMKTVSDLLSETEDAVDDNGTIFAVVAARDLEIMRT